MVCQPSRVVKVPEKMYYRENLKKKKKVCTPEN
jgi:hypothetical protein